MRVGLAQLGGGRMHGGLFRRGTSRQRDELFGVCFGRFLKFFCEKRDFELSFKLQNFSGAFWRKISTPLPAHLSLWKTPRRGVWLLGRPAKARGQIDGARSLARHSIAEGAGRLETTIVQISCWWMRQPRGLAIPRLECNSACPASY